MKRNLFIIFCLLFVFASCANKQKALDYINTELYAKRFDNANGFLKKYDSGFTEIEKRHLKFYVDELQIFYTGFYKCQQKYKLGSPETFWETKVCLDNLDYSSLLKLRAGFHPLFSNHLKAYEDFDKAFNKEYMAYQTDIGASNLPEFAFGIIKYNVKPVLKGKELEEFTKEHLINSLSEVYDKSKPPKKVDEHYLDFVKQNLFLKIEKLKGKNLNAEEIEKILTEEILSEKFSNFDLKSNKYVFHVSNAIFYLYFPKNALAYFDFINKFRRLKMVFNEIFTSEISEEQYLIRTYEQNKKTVTKIEQIEKTFRDLKKISTFEIPVTNFEISMLDITDKLIKFYSMQKIVAVKKKLCQNYKMKDTYEDIRAKEFDLIKLGKEVDQNEVKKHTLVIAELEKNILIDEREFFRETRQVFSYRKLCN